MDGKVLMCFIFSVYYDIPMTETCMQIHEPATCNVYKALNAIHVQCSTGHAPVTDNSGGLHLKEHSMYSVKH